MALKTTLSCLFLNLFIYLYGQGNDLIVPGNIRLPKDTVVSKQLLSSLNGFLALKEKPNNENTFVLKEDLLETSALLDEMGEIEKSVKYKDDHFFKGYLSTVVKLDSVTYLIQFAYMGINENTPILRASFEVIGKLKDNQFHFSSPLKRNTLAWQTKKIGDITFHYRSTLHLDIAKAYSEKAAFYDEKLKASGMQTEIYCCDKFPEALQMSGVLYKSDYNGVPENSLDARQNNELLLVNGATGASLNTFDPHDLWHERLRNTVPDSIINRPVDEGCAYLYGGSWGISWNQVLKTFKEKVASNSKADWLSLYEQLYNFSENKRESLIVSYVINALLVQKIEKENGFPAVMELLTCGKYEKGNANYFKTLEKLTGITKDNFNEKIGLLIKNSGQ